MAKLFQENVFQNQKAGVVLQKVFQVEDAAPGGIGSGAIWLRRRRRMNRELRHRGKH